MESHEQGQRVAVVGIGYVGLTLLCALADAGYPALGYDVDARKVHEAGAGRMPFESGETALDALLARQVAAGRLSTTTDPARLREVDAVFIAVETPVDETDHRPRYVALRGALQAIASHLKRGVLVVLESTLAPGTTRGLALPVLSEALGAVGADFHLVHCPERVMPGRLLQNISTCDRVVGGITPACTEKALPFYRRVTKGTLHPTDATTAEIVKTAENAYRDVQIAFANELALICEELGTDVYRVRELVNSSPFRAMHLPGAGVGGHCIPKDPWLLVSSVNGHQPRLLPAARAINDGMPLHLAALTQGALAAEGRTLDGATITILGAAYLEESDDTRNTPALILARALTAAGATVRLLDPYVSELEGFPVTASLDALDGADALVLVTGHQLFKALDLSAVAARMHTRILIDGRNVYDPAAARAAGFRFLALGKGETLVVGEATA